MYYQEDNSPPHQTDKSFQSFPLSDPNKQQCTPKSNFIEEMRKRINQYHLQKIKKAEHKKEECEWYKMQVKAKHALMELEESSLLDSDPKSIQLQKNIRTQEISGWNHEMLKVRKKYKSSYIQKQKQRPQQIAYNYEKQQFINQQAQCISARMMESKQNARLEALGDCDKKNANMIVYLKSLLNSLQSPTNKNSHNFNHRPKIQSQSKSFKLKTQQTVAKMRRSKISLHKIQGYQFENRQKQLGNMEKDSHSRVGVKASESGSSNNQNRALTYRKTEKIDGKFKAIDAISRQNQSQNRPAAIQSQNRNRDYKKINRRGVQNQNDFDIAQEKDILQQLIRGTSNPKNSLTGNYYSQKSSNAEKFTLKNLLC